MISFGKKLRQLRKARGLTQRELARRVAQRLPPKGRGFGFTYLSKIENEKAPPPSSALIIHLAEVLGADANELIALAGKAPPRFLEKTLKESESARTFFRSAFEADLSDEDWRELSLELKRRRKAREGAPPRSALPLVAVVMAGGAGTRFWPLSTAERPKQFLRLFGDRSLLQLTWDRLDGLVPPEHRLVLTHRDFTGQVAEQLPDLPRERLVGEPLRRDTAAAVCLAAFLVRRLFGEAVMAVLPADHRIEPTGRFQEVLRSAVRAAEEGDALYTFGIPPAFPATGYGYLQRGEKVAQDGSITHYRLRAFREKPDRATAQRFCQSGEYYWNSGMFCWTTSAILREVERHLPTHAERLAPAAERFPGPGWEAALEEAFRELPRLSIDYGVMERAGHVRMVEADFSWSDMGGWPAVGDFLAPDAQGNRHRGILRARQARSNLIFCEDPEETVALLGVEDLLVVRAGSRTLVADRRHAEEVRKLVEEME